MAKEIIAYKGFNKDMTCRGFQYEIGKSYQHDGEVVRCASGGFHSCEMPLDAWSYYPPNTSEFAVVAAAGKVDRVENEDSKIASAKITITASISLTATHRRRAITATHLSKARTPSLPPLVRTVPRSPPKEAPYRFPVTTTIGTSSRFALRWSVRMESRPVRPIA